MNTKECEINNKYSIPKSLNLLKFLSIIAESLWVFFKGRELMIVIVENNLGHVWISFIAENWKLIAENTIPK